MRLWRSALAAATIAFLAGVDADVDCATEHPGMVQCNTPKYRGLPKDGGLPSETTGTCARTSPYCCPSEDCGDFDVKTTFDTDSDMPPPVVDGATTRPGIPVEWRREPIVIGGPTTGGGPDPDGCCGGGSACGYSYCETSIKQLILSGTCSPSSTKDGMCCQLFTLPGNACPGAASLPLPVPSPAPGGIPVEWRREPTVIGGPTLGGGPDPDGCCSGGSACGYSYCETFVETFVVEGACAPSSTKLGMCCQLFTLPGNACPDAAPSPDAALDGVCPADEPEPWTPCGPTPVFDCRYDDPYCSAECDGEVWQHLCEMKPLPFDPEPVLDCSALPCGADCTPACPPGMMCPTVMQYCQPDGTCGMNADVACPDESKPDIDLIIPYSTPDSKGGEISETGIAKTGISEPEPEPTDQGGESFDGYREKVYDTPPVDDDCVVCDPARSRHRLLFASMPSNTKCC